MWLVETYPETGSITEAARRRHTSMERPALRKDGVKGLGGRSRRPHHFPTQTAPRIEAGVVGAKKATGYGRKTLAWSPILCRNTFMGRKKKAFSPPTGRGSGSEANSSPKPQPQSSRAWATP